MLVLGHVHNVDHAPFAIPLGAQDGRLNCSPILLIMPRILFVSGFHPSTRAKDLAYEFER